MLIGTTLNEFVTAASTPGADAMTNETLAKRVEANFPGKGEAIIAAFRKTTPEEKPFGLFSRISAAPVRQSAVWQAERKAAQGKAPAFLYWFTWQTPVLDGAPGSFHCLELPFVFDNIDRCANMTGGGPEARALADKMSEAWIHFARSGDPNHAALPKWEAFSAEKCPTMVFDNECALRINPDTEERASLRG
ncbi:carboxylesterase family protein [Candidatus Sumerlaeota bacterium]|nr:carboxylesterase family protein [Candidatus Sumerlaeota bacterium]